MIDYESNTKNNLYKNIIIIIFNKHIAAYTKIIKNMASQKINANMKITI